MLSNSVLLCQAVFISVTANNTGESYVKWVVSQSLLGSVGLGEITVYVVVRMKANLSVYGEVVLFNHCGMH